MTNPLTEAIAKFRATQERYADFGACDTEPRGVFADLLVDTYDYKAVTLPRTAHDWQLYSGEGMKGVGLAAAALTRAARKVLAVADDERLLLARYLEDQGWR